MAPELAETEGSRFAFAILDSPMSDHPIEVASHRVIHSAGLDLLPDFAQHLLGWRESIPSTIAIRTAAMAYATAMRAASGATAVAEIAHRRAAA